MKRARVAMVVIGTVAAFGGAFAASPRGALAAHEATCFAALRSGRYNVIVGSGTINGANGNDLIIGSAGADTFHAGNGDDIVSGRSGDDAISGANGNDSLLGDVCDSCEQIAGAGANGVPGQDTVSGGNGGDRIWGDEADDQLSGQNGNDALFGGNPGGDGDETDRCDGANWTNSAARCDVMVRIP